MITNFKAPLTNLERTIIKHYLTTVEDEDSDEQVKLHLVEVLLADNEFAAQVELNRMRQAQSDKPH